MVTFLLYLNSRLGRKCEGILKEEGALTNRNNLVGPKNKQKQCYKLRPSYFLEYKLVARDYEYIPA